MPNASEHQQTLADGVEKAILEYIRQAHLEPGALLPKEVDLAKKMNVSRHIIREGVSRLKALGIIESRKHRGMILCRPNAFEGLRKIASADLLSHLEQNQFMELRVALELGMADFIFARRTPEKIKQLRKLAGSAQEYTHEYDEELAFHCCLMECSGNGVVSQFRKILESAFQEPGPISTPKVIPPSHFELVNVLENGTADKFRRAMRSHFTPYITHLLPKHTTTKTKVIDK